MGACDVRWSDQTELPPERVRVAGRERELAELESVLLGSALEPVPLMVVHGRRGIGKTTLAAAVAQRACAHHIEVVWATGSALREVPAGSLVILDDACEAGAAKLARLSELARQSGSLRLLVLCRGARYRLEARLAGWLDQIQSERGCRFLMLAPLEQDAADTLIRAACGERMPAAIVAAIGERTAGDPSVIREFAHALRSKRELDLSAEVPEAILGLAGLRLATLGEQEAAAAELASLFSHAFAVDWLAAAAQLTEPAALAALRSAEDAGLVVQNGDDRFEMSAPAVRDAVRTLAFGGNLQRAHRRLAQALMDLPPEAHATASAEATRQYHSSRQLPGADRGVEPALQAAEQALAASAPLRAAELLELGLELCEGDHPAAQARLTSALARVWASALCHQKAIEALEDACQKLRISGAGSPQIVELVTEVASALPLPLACVDAPATHRIRAIVGHPDERSGECLDAALHSRRPQITGAAQLYERMVRIGMTADSRQRTAAMFRAAAETVEVLVDAAITRPLLQQATEQAERLGSHAARSLTYALRAVAAGRAGELSCAAELARAGVDEHRRSTPNEPPLAQLIELLTRIHSAPDWEQLAASATGLAAESWSSRYSVSFAACAALARVNAGDHAGAREELRDVIAALEPMRRYTSSANAALGPAVEAAWRLGDAQLSARLAPVAQRLLAAGCGDFYMSQRDLTAARLALIGGSWEQARAAYDRATIALDQASERTLRATLELEYGQALTAHGSPLGAELRVIAERRFEQLGLVAPAAGETEAGAVAGPDGLTRRQLEVLLLVSEGLTSQQIAARLFVSINTVNRHVADIYRKIGATNRVGAAAYVARNGLAP